MISLISSRLTDGDRSTFQDSLLEIRQLTNRHVVGCTLPDLETFSGCFDYSRLPENILLENRILIESTSTIREDFRISIEGSKNTVIIAHGASLSSGEIVIRGDNSIVIIGAKVILRNTRISASSLSRVVLGEKFTCMGGNILAEGTGGYILCGDDCMCAHGISIRTDDGHGVFDRSTRKRINNTAPVIVHEHVWLGGGVRVNKGSIIHEGAIVGQLSVVTGELDPYTSYVGTPAKKLREDVVWSRSNKWEDIAERYR